MACRLKNTGTAPLRVDLADGGLLYLEPRATSGPLREELLYGNVYLADWERRGLVTRLAASMSEVRQAEGSAVHVPDAPAGAPAASAESPAESPAATARRAAARKTKS
jgi:hypothetical protein